MSQPTHETADTPAPATPVARSSMLGKIIMLLVLAVVVAGECIVAQMFLPSVEEAAALAGTKAPAVATAAADGEAQGESSHKDAGKHAGEHGGDKEGEKAPLDPNGQVEVDLGEFGVTAYVPASNSTLRIDFHLYGAVESKDQATFLRLIEENKHRFREQVLVIVRSAEITDLTDAGLGLIKRKILDKTNRMIGRPMLKAVIVSDFSFIEQ